MIKSGKLYDQLKFIAQIALPALGTLYFTIAQIWGLPNGTEVVGTIMAVDAFLGILLGISTAQYNNSDAKYGGQIEVAQSPTGDTKTYSLSLNTPPDEIDQQKEITFKVVPPGA